VYGSIEQCIMILLQCALDEEHRSMKRELREKKRMIHKRLKNSQNNIRYQNLVNEHFAAIKLANEAFSLLQRVAKELHKIDELIKQAKQKRKDCKSIRDYSKADEITSLISQLSSIYAGLKKERDAFDTKTHELNDNTARLRERIHSNCGARGQRWYTRLRARKHS